ncbi:MAG: sulfate permease [Methanotrichaceae archaeon]|nr:sulfate permease [Methanotrichaceae archaeon]
MSKKPQNHQLKATIKSFLPILNWLPRYERSWLRWDFVAALTVWALFVPEGMAYATLAGVPPEAGLYAAPLAAIGYAIFGTSRHMTVGPSSTVAIMSALVVAPVAAGDPERFVVLAEVLAVLVGGLLVASGLLRFGVLVDFMSNPVLTGFIIGLALTIVVGQLDKMLGYGVGDVGFFREVWFFIRDLGMAHIPTLAVGMISLFLLFAVHKFIPKIPAALAVMVLSIMASSVFDLESFGVHVVGSIPTGFPSFGMPSGITFSELIMLLPGAAGIVLVAFSESVAIARSYATSHGYEVDANREMIGLGFANLGAGMSQGFVVDGSMSRSSASDQAGVKSQMSSLILAAMVLVTILALTPLFHSLTEATLGAIVIHAVWHLIDFSKLKRLYRVRFDDFVAASVALLGVLVLGILPGLVLAVLLSLLLLLRRIKTPSMAVLGRVPGKDIFRNIKNYPGAGTYPGLLILRFDGLLFFANAPNFRNCVRSLVEDDPAVRMVLIDAESITDIDSTAIDMLEKLHDELTRSNVNLSFSRMNKEVREILHRSGLEDAIGTDHFYMSVREGVDAYLAESKR